MRWLIQQPFYYVMIFWGWSLAGLGWAVLHREVTRVTGWYTADGWTDLEGPRWHHICAWHLAGAQDELPLCSFVAGLPHVASRQNS